MKKRVIGIITLGIVHVLFLSQTVMSAPWHTDYSWKSIHLRTEAQKRDGLKGGEGFQMIWDIEWSKSNPDVVYFITDTRQVMKSTDGGVSWFLINEGFYPNGGTSIAIDPHNEDVVYAACGTMLSSTDSGSIIDGIYSEKVESTVGGIDYESIFDAVDKEDESIIGGIYRTTNGGASWERVLPGGYFRIRKCKGTDLFYIDPDSFDGSKCTDIYAAVQDDGSGGAVYLSTDGGDSWTKKTSTDFGKIYFLESNPHTLFVELWVGCEKGLFKVEDPGGNQEFDVEQVNLSEIGLPDESDIDTKPNCMAFHPEDNNVRYVTCGKKGIYKSIDNGAWFTAKNTGLIDTKVYGGTKLCPNDPDWIITSCDMYDYGYMSTDGGNSWKKMSWNNGIKFDVGEYLGDIRHLNDEAEYYFIIPVAFHPVDPDKAITVGYGSRPEITANRYDWYYTGNGYSGGRASKSKSAFAFGPDNPETMWVFLVDYGFHRTCDGGKTWKQLNPDNGIANAYAGAIDPEDTTHIIAAYGARSSQTLYQSVDNGNTWSLVDGAGPMDYRFVAFHPQNHDIVYAGEYKSTDGGNTWTSVGYPIMAVYPGNGSIVYSKRWKSGYEGEQAEIIKSIDEGLTWTEYTEETINTGSLGSINDIAVHPTDDTIFYVAVFDQGIYQFTSAEKTIILDQADVYGNKPYVNVVIDPMNPNVIVAGGRRADYHTKCLYVSDDSGATWTPLLSSFNDCFNVWSLNINPYNDTVYLGGSHGTKGMSSLIGNYHLEENGNNNSIYDCDGNANCSIKGGGNYCDIDRPVGEKGVDLDGDSGYIEIPSTDFMESAINGEKMTFLIWVNLDDKDQENQTIFTVYANNTSWISLKRLNTGKLQVEETIGDMSWGESTRQGTRMTSDVSWYHVAWVIDGTTTTLYVNGTHNEIFTMPNAISSIDENAKILIGTRDTTDYFLDGIVDDIKIYNRALSEDEILNQYKFTRDESLKKPGQGGKK